jgi:hypothetical protein
MRRGRPFIFWALIGFLFGLWAFILVLIVGKRSDITDAPPSSFPPTSDAA